MIFDKGCDNEAQGADVNHKGCAQDTVANNVAVAEVHSLCYK